MRIACEFEGRSVSPALSADRNLEAALTLIP